MKAQRKVRELAIDRIRPAHLAWSTRGCIESLREVSMVSCQSQIVNRIGVQLQVGVNILRPLTLSEAVESFNSC